MDEDLLVTNAFYPIISIKDTGIVKKGNTEYNYYRESKKPYLRENLGPYPNIKLHDDKFYDDRTQKDFKSYLKKKEKLIDEQTFTPSLKERNIDTSSKFGSLPSNQSGLGSSYQTTEIKKKDFGNDLLKYSQAEEGFDESGVNRVIRDTVYTINIDSRWRDGSVIKKFGTGFIYENSTISPDSYTITLAKPIRNIKMVEMKSSEFPYSFPCVDTSLATPVEYYYFVISIEELNNLTNSGIIIINPQYETSAANVSSFFTKVQLNGAKPTPIIDGYQTNSILYNCHVPFTSVYTNAIPEVSKLTIKFLMPNGYPYKITDHSFTLEFITYTDSTSVTDISTRRGATDITLFNKILK
jgi:hypothetical protein